MLYIYKNQCKIFILNDSSKINMLLLMKIYSTEAILAADDASIASAESVDLVSAVR